MLPGTEFSRKFLIQMKGLKAITITFIQQHVTIDDVFEIIEIARTLSATKLEDHCIYFIALHLTKIVKKYPEKLIFLIQENATSIKHRQVSLFKEFSDYKRKLIPFLLLMKFGHI
jgi:hypothetical protein